MNGQVGHRRVTEPPLTERVAARLRDLIVQDELKPGERIRERELAERLAVSRTPLREALKGLAAEGLVELSPNRSATVANPEPQEIRDLRAAQIEASITAGKCYLAAYAQRIGASGLTFYDDDVTNFFSPHAAGKSVMFLIAIGKRAPRNRQQ